MYIPPTKEEFRGLLKKWNLTGAEAGKIINQTSRSIRKYTGGSSKIKYTALFTLCAKCEGKFITHNWREETKQE